MFKKFLIILIILCSILFFNFTFLGKFSKLLELLGIALIIVIIILYSIYDNSFRFKHTFSPYIAIILLSLPFSMYVADKFHNQSIGISLYAQRSMYYYLLYFALHQIKIKPEYFEKLFIFFGVIFILFNLLQYILYPKIILFNAYILQERGTIRIYLASMSYLVIFYYYSLQNFLEKIQLKYTIFLLLTLIIVILQGSRSLLFTIAVTTLLNLILSKRIKSKLLIYFLSAVGIILIYFMFQNIFQKLITITLYKEPILSENVRFRAIIYFLSKFFPNTLAYIFGNGASGAQSEFSHSLEMISGKYGYFLADIGLIGEYVNYGILFVIGVFFIIYKSLISKIQPKYNYIKYFYVFASFGIIIGGGFDDSDFIVVMCITLYMLDVSKFNLNCQNPNNIPAKTDNLI